METAQVKPEAESSGVEGRAQRRRSAVATPGPPSRDRVDLDADLVLEEGRGVGNDPALGVGDRARAAEIHGVVAEDVRRGHVVVGSDGVRRVEPPILQGTLAVTSTSSFLGALCQVGRAVEVDAVNVTEAIRRRRTVGRV